MGNHVSLRRKKALLRTFTGLAALALLFAAVFMPSAVRASAATRKLPVYCVQRDDKCVSLTFDAAWGNEDTQTLIDILGQYNVKATFFVVGAWVDKYPESVKALSDAGHEVMSHSNDHAHFSSLSAEEIVANLNTCNDKIEAVTGVRPTLFRCPYGEYDDHVVSTVTDMGMYTIQWDVEQMAAASSRWGTRACRVRKVPWYHRPTPKDAYTILETEEKARVKLTFKWRRVIINRINRNKIRIEEGNGYRRNSDEHAPVTICSQGR